MRKQFNEQERQQLYTTPTTEEQEQEKKQSRHDAPYLTIEVPLKRLVGVVNQQLLQIVLGPKIFETFGGREGGGERCRRRGPAERQKR